MTVYRSFQLTVVLDLLTVNMVINPTLVISGNLQNGSPENLSILTPGQEAIWYVETSNFNEGVRFIAQLSAPNSKQPMTIECNMPVFGKASCNLDQLPSGLTYSCGGSVLEGLYAMAVVTLTPDTTDSTSSYRAFSR